MNNLYYIINQIKKITLEHKLINRFTEGDIYTNLNEEKDKLYPTVNLTIDTVLVNGDYQTINGYLYYIDRLLDDESNKIEIQTVGIRSLQSIINKLSEIYNWNITSQTYNPFTEKFADLCAGVYVTFTMEVPAEEICADDLFVPAVINITKNGEYDVTAYDKAIVNDPDAVLGQIIRERNDYKQRYAQIIPTLNEEYPEIVGWLYTQTALYASNHLYFTLKGADAYYIVNDGVYAYENGDATNPITYVDAEGVETVGGRDYAKTNADMNTEYEILYGYVMNSEADGVRDYYNFIDCMYCDDAIIPVIRQIGQNHSYGFVELNFREGYRDVNIYYTGEYAIIGFSTNAETLNKDNYSNQVFNANTKGLYVLQFNNLKELKYSVLIQAAYNIEKISLPALKHISAPGKSTTNSYGIVTNCRNLKELNLPNLETIELERAFQGTIASNCPNLERVVCPKLKTIECIIASDYQVPLIGCNKLTSVSMPELTSVIMKGAYAYTFNLTNLTNLDLPKLEYFYTGGNVYESLIYNSTIEELSLPSLKEAHIDYRGYLIQYCNTLKRVYLPSLKKSPQVFSWYYPNWLRSCPNVEYVYLGCRGGVDDKIGFGADSTEFLTDVEIGEGTRQSIALFNINNLTRDNIVNHIFNKLADNTDGAPLRITIGSTNLARLSDEDKEIALNKNYTLA